MIVGCFFWFLCNRLLSAHGYLRALGVFDRDCSMFYVKSDFCIFRFVVIFLLFVCLMLFKSEVSFGEPDVGLGSYRLLMNGDDAVCRAIGARVFSKSDDALVDVKVDGDVSLDFIKWVEVKPVHVDHMPIMCNKLEVSTLDFDRDGVDEIVRRQSGCLGGYQINWIDTYDWKKKKGLRTGWPNITSRSNYYKFSKMESLGRLSHYFRFDIFRVYVGEEMANFLWVSQHPKMGSDEGYQVFAKIRKDYTLEDICYFSRDQQE